MEDENVSTKRSEPAADTIDFSFDSPDNKKDDKLPRKQVDPVKPYPPEPTFGSAAHQSSASASSTGYTPAPVPDLPAFRGQSGVMHVQPPYRSPQFGIQPASTTYGPMTAHGPQLHTTYAPSQAHYNPQAIQANAADNRVNAQFADNRQVWIHNRQYNIQQLDYTTLNNVLNGFLAQQAQASQSNDRNLQIFLAHGPGSFAGIRKVPAGALKGS